MAKTNYNKMSNQPKEDVKNETKAVEETAAVAVTETKKGVVAGCTLLNVRKEPNLSAEVARTLSANQEVTIVDEEGDFYKIGNPDSNEFCMKKYISVK